MNALLWPLALVAALLLALLGLRIAARRNQSRRSRLFGAAKSIPCATTTTWESLYGKSTASDLPAPRDFSQGYTADDFRSQRADSDAPKAPAPGSADKSSDAPR